MALPNVEVCYVSTPLRLKESLHIVKKASGTSIALAILHLYACCEFDKLINPKMKHSQLYGEQFGFRFKFN
jgi:hypothetical protein